MLQLVKARLQFFFALLIDRSYWRLQKQKVLFFKMNHFEDNSKVSVSLVCSY